MEGSRAARAHDLDRVEALADEAVAALSELRGGAVWSRREARASPRRHDLDAALSDDRQLLVVGTIDEAVVGYGAVRTEALHDGSDLGVITDIYVEPGARGVGVGEAMMNQLVAWSEAQGCVGVDSLALPGDRATKNFFEAHGLVARAIVVHRRLR